MRYLSSVSQCDFVCLQAFINERAAPELLAFQEGLIERLQSMIKDQVFLQ